MTGTAYARAGLLGNPSDGYGGKAIAVSLSDFRVQVDLEAGESVSARGSFSHDRVQRTLLALKDDFPIRDSDDGTALLEAALRRFLKAFPEIAQRGPEDPGFRFSMRFQTDIPRQVGLAGSSAIVIAGLRALSQWFSAELPVHAMAELALAAETQELGIAAGPMDRIIQAQEGLVAMDLSQPGDCSTYRVMDTACLPAFFLVWDPRGGQPSGQAHGDFKRRWERGDPEVLAAIGAFRDLVDEGLALLERRDFAGFRDAMDQNFALRQKVFQVGERDQEMVALARRYGAGAKLCGSGGAVIGSPRSESDFEILKRKYLEMGYGFIRPQVRVPGHEMRREGEEA
ncbi:MAG: hypothetical protein VX252_10250 [Myxococcota bacterium]|nr:hypothetical protein [Myxococcota bacterium]